VPTLFPYTLNWAKGFQIDRIYKTTIIEHDDGNEDRVGHRISPRKIVEFTVQTTPKRAHELQHFLQNFVQNEFWVPDFGREFVTDADTTGTNTLEGTIPMWVRNGRELILKNPAGDQQVAEVDSKGGGVVTLLATLTIDCPVGTKVYHALRCRLRQVIDMPMITSEVAEVRLEFEETPQEYAFESYVSHDPANWFDGREVFLLKPNWSRSVGMGLDGMLGKYDENLGGVPTFFQKQVYNPRRWQANYLRRDEDEVEELIRFFHRKGGARVSFFMPTWREDMVLAADSIVIDYDDVPGPTDGPFEPDPDDAYRIRVEGTSILDYWTNHSEMFNRLCLQMADGSYIFNTITNMVAIGGDTRIIVRDPWTVDITSESVQKIMFMPLWRFANDTLTLDFETPKVASARLNLTQLRSDFTDDGFMYLTGGGAGSPGLGYCHDGVALFDETIDLFDNPAPSTNSDEHNYLVDIYMTAEGSINPFWIPTVGDEALTRIEYEYWVYEDDGAGGVGDLIFSSGLIFSDTLDGYVEDTVIGIEIPIEGRFFRLRSLSRLVILDFVANPIARRCDYIHVRGRP
jgi:hypothetical protein